MYFLINDLLIVKRKPPFSGKLPLIYCILTRVYGRFRQAFGTNVILFVLSFST